MCPGLNLGDCADTPAISQIANTPHPPVFARAARLSLHWRPVAPARSFELALASVGGPRAMSIAPGCCQVQPPGCPRGAAQATPSGAGNRKLARDEGAS